MLLGNYHRTIWTQLYYVFILHCIHSQSFQHPLHVLHPFDSFVSFQPASPVNPSRRVNIQQYHFSLLLSVSVRLAESRSEPVTDDAALSRQEVSEENLFSIRNNEFE